MSINNICNNLEHKPIVVIKCGGSILYKNDWLSRLTRDIYQLQQSGFKVIIVHGGGPEITDLSNHLNIKTVFNNGQRVTNTDVLEVTHMALLGKTNCHLVYQLNQGGVRAIGLSGHDVNLIQADFIDQARLGFVGYVTSINQDLLQSLVHLDLVPVVAPLGVDSNGNSFNINADLVAAQIAKIISASSLIMLSNIDGFYQDINDKNTLVQELSITQIKQMLDKNKVVSGMIPKLSACQLAKSGGVNKCHIVNGEIPHVLINMLIDNQSIGTEIIGE